MAETDDDVLSTWRDRIGTLRKPGPIGTAALATQPVEVDARLGRPPAPQRLSAEERDLWERLTFSRRPGWFAGAEALLESYVSTIVHVQKIEASLRVTEPGSRSYPKLMRLHRQSVALATTLATRLRLTPSSKLDKRAPTDGELPVT